MELSGVKLCDVHVFCKGSHEKKTLYTLEVEYAAGIMFKNKHEYMQESEEYYDHFAAMVAYALKVGWYYTHKDWHVALFESAI